MKTIKSKSKESGYLRNIRKVWEMKDAAYRETKDLNYDDYMLYIRNQIKSSKDRLKNRLVKG